MCGCHCMFDMVQYFIFISKYMFEHVIIFLLSSVQSVLFLQSNEKKFNEMKKFNNELSILAKNCSNFRLIRKYIDFPLTAEEQAYPIAYIITIHKYVYRDIKYSKIIISWYNIIRFKPSNILR